MQVIRQFWLGTPSKYQEGREDLAIYPAGDLGGRELGLPTATTPQDVFDVTMPRIVKLQAQAQQRFQGGLEPQLHPFGILAQGVQTTWMFTSEQFARQQEEIDSLKTSVARLEKLLSPENASQN